MEDMNVCSECQQCMVAPRMCNLTKKGQMIWLRWVAANPWMCHFMKKGTHTYFRWVVRWHETRWYGTSILIYSLINWLMGKLNWFGLSGLIDLIFNSSQLNSDQVNSISIQLNTIQFNSIQFNSIQSNPIQINSIQGNSIQSNIQFNSI